MTALRCLSVRTSRMFMKLIIIIILMIGRVSTLCELCQVGGLFVGFAFRRFVDTITLALSG